MFALLSCMTSHPKAYYHMASITHPSDSRSSLSSIWYRREEGWWMVVRTALPPCASCRSVATKCMAVVLSRPVHSMSDESTFMKLIQLARTAASELTHICMLCPISARCMHSDCGINPDGSTHAV